MNSYIEKKLKKVSCFSRLDIDKIPTEETVVFHDDGEHFFTVRREKHANIFAMRSIDGMTVLEVLEYLENNQLETLKKDNKACDSQLYLFFCSAIRDKGRNKDLNKDDFFYEANQLIFELKKYPEYLTEEELYRLTVTLPTDLVELKKVYQSFSPEDRKNTQNFLVDTKEFLKDELTKLKTLVMNRKTDKIDLRTRVIKERFKNF